MATLCQPKSKRANFAGNAAFKSFVNVHHPKYAIRFSEMNLRRDGAFINIPIYLVPRFAACLD